MTLDPSATKLTIGCGICFYNDHRSLHRCLDSIAGNVDYVFAVDGRYSYLKNDEYFTHPLSTDGSREVVDCFRDKHVFLIDKPDLRESEKRQQVNQIAALYGCDLLLILDSDEYIFSADWLKFRVECYQKAIVRDKGTILVYNVPFREIDRPRLFYNPGRLRYGLTHYDFYDAEDKRKTLIHMGGNTLHLIEGICISHRHNLRDAEHIFARDRWELEQQKQEDHQRYGPNFKGLMHVRTADEIFDPRLNMVVRPQAKKEDEQKDA